MSRSTQTAMSATPTSATPTATAASAEAAPATAAPATEAPADTATAADRPLRADARRNRDAVLATAAAAFAEHGVEASLEDIAKSTGVGIGTLYRHFPTREDLVYGVYRREVEQLSASAPELAAELPPAQALREWMRRFVQYAATKRGLVGMLRSMMQTQAERFADIRTLVRDAAEMLLVAAADAGEIRGDICADDLMRSMGGICMANDQTGPPENAERLVDLVFDGLRYGAPKAG